MISEKHAKAYCYEDISLIENYDKAVTDDTQVWDIHHRLEIQGPFVNSQELLKRCGMYENVPAWQLIFLMPSEHSRLHGRNRSEKTRIKLSAALKGNKYFLGHKHTEETKAKMSEAKSGENHPMYGKHHSKETRAKISATSAGKHLTKETRGKMSAAHTGKHHTEETKAKMSETELGKRLGWHFWTNGIENRYCKECPGEGWRRGRLKNTPSQ